MNTKEQASAAAADRLVGGWVLQGWEIMSDEGGPPTEPFGPRPTGLISYTPDGWMSTTICEPNRKLISTASPRKAPAEELKSAFISYFAYAGRWHVEGEEVVHEVRWALNPAMAGTIQRRRMTFAGNNELTLSAQETDERGRTRCHRIRWRREG